MFAYAPKASTASPSAQAITRSHAISTAAQEVRDFVVGSLDAQFSAAGPNVDLGPVKARRAPMSSPCNLDIHMEGFSHESPKRPLSPGAAPAAPNRSL